MGATGSGKSFLLNFFLTHVQKYAPHTYIFDLGGSYETLARLFGGSYFPVGVEKRAFTINPFSLPLTPENLLFLFAFIRVLIESSGYQLTAEDERDLYEQIESLYSIAPDQRRLFTLYNIVHRNLRGPLQKWVQGGPYAGLFDNAYDTLTLSRFQAFDFEGIDKAIDQLEPLLFYILHRANAALNDSGRVFKLFVMDEAWRFFRHPVIKAYVVEALKTWRKKNAAIVLATQSGEDLLASDLLPTIVESCPTKFFLANPGMDQTAYQRAFHLNETEAATVARLIPKQQMLLNRPDGSRVLSLNVDRKGYWLYTNNPKDNVLKQEAFQRYGFERGLEVLVKENP
ncbi:MAG: VirB4 family type IV secretion system protein [Bryobacteraceae bacterium]